MNADDVLETWWGTGDHVQKVTTFGLLRTECFDQSNVEKFVLACNAGGSTNVLKKTGITMVKEDFQKKTTEPTETDFLHEYPDDFKPWNVACWRVGMGLMLVPPSVYDWLRKQRKGKWEEQARALLEVVTTRKRLGKDAKKKGFGPILGEAVVPMNVIRGAAHYKVHWFMDINKEVEAKFLKIMFGVEFVKDKGLSIEEVD